MKPVRARRSRRRILRTQRFRAEIAAGLERYRAKLAVPSRPSGVVLIPTIRHAAPSLVRRTLNAAGLATIRFDLAQGLARMEATELSERLTTIATRLQVHTGHPVGLRASAAFPAAAIQAAQASRAIGALSLEGNESETLTDAARWLAQHLEAGEDLEEVLHSLQHSSHRLRRVAAAAALAAGAVSLSPTAAGAAPSSSFADGFLNVSLASGGDFATLTCVSGKVKINNNDVGTGPVNCPDVDQILVNGGSGNDNINLSGVSFDAGNGYGMSFVGTTITITGGGGSDTITGSSDFFDQLVDASANTAAGVTLGQGEDSVIGSSGGDALSPQGGADTIRGGNGPDALAGGSGNDRYVFADGGASFSGDGLFESAGQGTDVLDLSAFTAAVNIDLTGAHPMITNGASFTDSLSTGANFENALTGSGNDILRGNASDNSLDAGAGDDDGISAGSGNDTITGGGGTRDVVFEDSDVNMTLTPTSLTGGLGTDSLSGIEEADLAGGVGDNALDASGFAGVVRLTGRGGNDTLTGGSGAEDILIEEANANFVLTNTSLTGLGTDVLSGLEEGWLRGAGSAPNSFDASAFTGTVTLEGIGGDDTLTGGTNSDSLDGGNDTDRVVAGGDVSFTLTDTSLTGLGTDTLGSIEAASLTGGTSANTIDASGFSGTTEINGDGPLGVGSGGADSITGGSGSDTINGQHGGDTIEGGPGSDLVLGREGDDRFVFGTNIGTANDTISEGAFTNSGNDTYDFTALTDDASINLGTSGAAATVPSTGWMLTSGVGRQVETALGGSGDDTLTGGLQSNLMDGGGGDDHFTPAGSTTDTMAGGTGSGDRIVDTGPFFDFGLGNTFIVTGPVTHSFSDIEQAHLTGTSGADSMNALLFDGDTTLLGQDGSDSLNGSASGDDSIVGSSGLDILTGHGGNDTLVGNTGSDTLDGGFGADTLLGGPDGDRYVFGSTIGAAGDTMSESSVASGTGNDLIDLVDAPTASGGYNINLNSDTLATGNGGWSLTAQTAGEHDVEDAAGSDAGDTLAGDDSPNSLTGNEGDDRFQVDGEPDTMNGGLGTDTVVGTAGGFNLSDTTLIADGFGSDAIFGIEAANLTGLGTDDQLNLQAFTGAATAAGAAGNDTLLGGPGTNSLLGNEGSDSLSGGGGNDTTVGGTGNDLHSFSEATSPETDLIREFPSGGTDEVSFANLSSTDPVTADLRPGAPNHLAVHTNRTVSLDSGAAGAAATPMVENLTGGQGNDSLTGSQGINTIAGGGGNDTIGATFKDKVDGGGGTGDRTNVKGFDPSEVYNPGAAGLQGVELLNVFMLGGNDNINVSTVIGLVSTTLEGGTGNDTITGASSNDTLVGQAGNDIMDGKGGNDRVNGLDGLDTLSGGDGNDTLLGGLLNDLLGGGAGNDSLKGEDGDDTLNGGDGDDTLEGGPGNDSLNGGAGTNVLIP